MKRLSVFLATFALLAVILAACVALPSPEIGVVEPQMAASRSLTVAGTTTLNGATVISNTLQVSDTTALIGATTVTGALVANGATTISNTLTVSDTTTLVGSVAAASATIGGGYGDTGCSISTAGVLQCDGAATVGGTLLVTGQANLNSVVSMAGIVPQVAGSITVTQDLQLVPGATFQPLTAEDDWSTGDIITAAAGWLVIFRNDSATTITISDTGTLQLGADCALGQTDTLTVISDGTNWLKIACSDN